MSRLVWAPYQNFVVKSFGVDELFIHGCRASGEQVVAWDGEAEAGYGLRQLPQLF